MKSSTRDMTAGKPAVLLLQFALPLMAGNLFQEFYTVVDTIIVGQFLGVHALAAIGAGGWITWMMTSAIQGFTQGFSVPAHIAQQAGYGLFGVLGLPAVTLHSYGGHYAFPPFVWDS